MISDRRIRTSLLAIAADVLLALIKLVSAWITGSAALLADAFHSLSDILVSVTLLSGLVIRYGVENKKLKLSENRVFRLEAILAIAMALLILYVPIEIIREVNEQQPEDLQHLWAGIIGILLCISIAWFMSRLKSWVGRETDSMALVADGYHSQLDVFSSTAVLFSLIGTMIGIYLDEVVAVIIAVMVGIAGLELLISGIRSFIVGSELEQLSLMDKLLDRINQHNLFQSTATVWQRIAFLKKPLSVTLLLLLIIAGYLLSGFRAVPQGDVGFAQFFNRTYSENLTPGLHYAPPWPIGRIVLVPKMQLHALHTDTLRRAELNEKVSNHIWSENYSVNGHQLMEDTLFLTLDENLVDISLSLHYRIDPQTRLSVHPQHIHRMMSGFAESALIQLASSHSFDSLMQDDRQLLQQKLKHSIQTDMQTVSLDVKIVDALIQSVKPPPRIVKYYWDMLNQYQNMLKEQLSAESKRQSDLPSANAEYLTMINQAQAQKNEQSLHTEGDLQRYQLLKDIYAAYSDMVHFNQFLQRAAKLLDNKPLILVDPALSQQDLRQWQTLIDPEARNGSQ